MTLQMELDWHHPRCTDDKLTEPQNMAHQQSLIAIRKTRSTSAINMQHWINVSCAGEMNCNKLFSTGAVAWHSD